MLNMFQQYSTNKMTTYTIIPPLLPCQWAEQCGAHLPAVGDYRLSFECTKSVEGSADAMLSVVCGGVEVKSYSINTITVGTWS